jgi:hypothetical protein
MIAVDGRECWTHFDSGARNTYVIPAVADSEDINDSENHPHGTWRFYQRDEH